MNFLTANPACLAHLRFEPFRSSFSSGHLELEFRWPKGELVRRIFELDSKCFQPIAVVRNAYLSGLSGPQALGLEFGSELQIGCYYQVQLDVHKLAGITLAAHFQNHFVVSRLALGYTRHMQREGRFLLLARH